MSLARPQVLHTIDYDRVVELPRRVPRQYEADAWAAVLTPQLRRPLSSAKLRPWQAYPLAELAEAPPGRGIVLWVGVGAGKALAHGEHVLTPAGYKLIEEMKVGDEVIGAKGTPVKVLGVYPQGERETWRVTFSDHTSIVCDADHLWTFSIHGRFHTRTTSDWARERLQRPCGAYKAHRIFAPMLLGPAQFPEKNLPIDPYTLGALLGDGGLTQGSKNFTSMDLDIVNALKLPEGVVLKPSKRQNSGKATQYNIQNSEECRHRRNPFTLQLNALGLRGVSSRTKFVPSAYLYASADQRLELLRGLLDTDGSVARRASAEYSTMSWELAIAVKHLVTSLGGTAVLSLSKKDAYRLRLKFPRGMMPFKCARKRDHYLLEADRAQRPPYRAVIAIEPEGRSFCTCIKVDAPDGLFAVSNCVMTHNTNVLALAPVMTNAERTLYIVPASLVEKTEADFAELRKDWRLSNSPYRVISRELLGQSRAQDLIDLYAPDLIAIDESDELSNLDASAVRRIDRYIVANEHVRVVSVTATPSRNSIMGYWHLLCWSLRDGAPVPLDRTEAQTWAQALDENARGPRRVGPGPLGADRKAATEWYSRRLIETPGLIIVDGDSCKAPLEIRERLAKEDPTLDEHYKVFLEEMRNPGGIDVTDPLSRWKLDGFLGCGLYTRYVEPPPEEWILARRAFAKFVRDAITRSTRSRKPLDSESQVVARFKEHPIVAKWLEVKATFKPRTEHVWLTDSTIESCREWLAESDEPGIVWCGSVEFGQALARAAGLRYFGRKGKSADGAVLYAPPRGESMVCSWNANKKGFNLQPWSRQLIVMPPQSAKWLEQIFGRSHRSGQEKAVTIDVLLTSGGTIDLISAALGEARFAKRTVSLTQKALRAKLRRATPARTPSNEYRWATRSDGEIALAA